MRDVIDTPEDLGLAIRRQRQAQRLSQEELALAAGTGRRFIGDLERGKRDVRLRSVLAVLTALGLRMELSGGAGEDRSRDERRGRP